MKIAIVGTHGTGKSTLSYMLAAEYKKQGKNIKIIQETARNCPFPINEEMKAEAALWIYYEHAKKEIEAKAKFDVVICDRSVFDSLVYAHHFGLVHVDFDLMWKLAILQCKRYEQVFFIEPDIEIHGDGTRSTDITFQSELHRLYEHLIKKFYIFPNMIRLKTSQIFSKDEIWKQYCFSQPSLPSSEDTSIHWEEEKAS